MPGRRTSYFDRYSASGSNRLDELVALQRGVIGNRIHLVASACYPFDSVLRVLAEPSFVLPAEGMPGARYLPGAGVMDLVENAGEDLTLKLFGRPAGYRASLQPHSGTQANQIVYNAVLGPDDTVLCLRPKDGGHISHTVLLSRRHTTVNYGLTADGTVDYHQMRQLALEHQPRLIIAGGSALTRAIDFGLCADIAGEAGALLHADVSHTATFVAAELHPSTFPHCDFVTFNSVKNLRGPNSGVLVYRSQFESEVAAVDLPDDAGRRQRDRHAGKARLPARMARAVTSAPTPPTSSRARGRWARSSSSAAYAWSAVEPTATCCCSIYGTLGCPGRRPSGGWRRSACWPTAISCREIRAHRGIRPACGSARRNLAILGYTPEDLARLADWLTQVLTGEAPSAETVEQLVDKYQGHLVAPMW